MVAKGTFSSPLPMTASHEGAGTVVALGSSVSPSAFKPGDRVMCGLTTDRCGKCPSCTEDQSYKHYCPNAGPNLGVTRDGAFAEYVVCDARESNVIPPGVEFETAAPLACAGRTVWRGVLQARLEKGQTLGIVGSGGGLGHIGIQFAKARGLRVVGIDARDEGLVLSEEVGADLVLDARKGKEEVVKQVHKFTGGLGCDATLNLSEASGAAALACAVTRMHRRMIQIAQPDDVSVPFAELVFRDIRIEGSLLCTKEQGDEMLEVVEKEGIKVKMNVFEGLEEIPKVVELVRGGKMQGKGVVVVAKETLETGRVGVGA